MKNKIYRKKWNFILKYTFKKLFDVFYQLSLRKHSAKAVSSGFLFEKIFVHKTKVYLHVLTKATFFAYHAWSIVFTPYYQGVYNATRTPS